MKLNELLITFNCIVFTFKSCDSKLVLSKNQRKKDYKHAEEHHAKGVQAAHSNDLIASLAYLRSACRLKPSDPILLNDLGVTEIRVGDFKNAMKRFLQALEIHPGNELAQSNVDELKAYMKPEEFNASFKTNRPQKHTIHQLNDVNPHHMSFKFLKAKQNSSNPSASIDYELLREPFIVRGALESWKWNLNDATDDEFLSYVTKQFGNVNVDFYPHNMNLETARPFIRPLEQVLTTLTNPQEAYQHVDASEPGTYLQWNIGPELWDDLLTKMNGTLPLLFDDTFWTDSCFESQQDVLEYHIKTHWKMVLIGEAGSGMFVHQDSLLTASYQFQLFGRKRWHLCPPSESAHLYKAGAVDMFNPDYDSYPNALKARCFDFIVEPGDFIYYPANYWHQTLNLDTPTVSFTGTIVTPHNYRSVTYMLEQECAGKGNTFLPNERFCRQLTSCFKLWKQCFIETEGTRFSKEEL